MEQQAEYKIDAPEDQPVPVRDLRTEKRFFVDNVIIRGYGPTLGVYGIAVYAALCMHANLQTQQCYPSHRTIADQLDCSIGKVRDAIRTLEKLHLIETAPRYDANNQRQTSNLYTLLDPPPLDVTPITTDTRPPYREMTTNNPQSDQSCLNKKTPPLADSPPSGEKHLERMRARLGNDPFSVAAHTEQARAQVEHPDFMDAAKDIDPWADKPLKAFCVLVGQDVDQLKASKRRDWPKTLQQWAQTFGHTVSPQEAFECIRGITQSEYNWMSFTSPRQTTFQETMDIMVGRLRGGKPFDAGINGKRNGNGRHDRTGGEVSEIIKPEQVRVLTPEETEEAMREYAAEHGSTDVPGVQGNGMDSHRPKKRRRLVPIRDESG